jgi:hypothetical protein
MESNRDRPLFPRNQGSVHEIRLAQIRGEAERVAAIRDNDRRGGQTKDAVRVWWLIVALAALIDRVMTFAYFIPTMIKLMNDKISPRSEASQPQCSG